jgi:hypothetical protein
MSHLQIGSPYNLKLLWTAPGTGKDETKLHAQLADFRVKGEWFFPVALDEFIAPAILRHESLKPKAAQKTPSKRTGSKFRQALQELRDINKTRKSEV